MTGRVLVVGDVIKDIIVKPAGPIAWGSDTPSTISEHPGGSAANAGSWLAACGVGVRLAARVGAADLNFKAMFSASGIEPALAADPEHASGTIVTLLAADGERSFLTERGANAHLSPVDLPDGLLEGIRLVHVSGYALFEPGPREAVRDLMKHAADRGLPVTVDPASGSFLRAVGPANFLAWTSGAAICFPNAEEAAILAGSADPAQQLAILARHYPGVVIKRGAGGAEALVEGAHHSVPAPIVEVMDATGAGDAFLGGYIAAWLAGASAPERLGAGVARGTSAVTRLGGRPGVVTPG